MKKHKHIDGIEYGTINVDASEFEPQNMKMRITTMIDGDVYEALKILAVKKNTKYQTLLNKILRKSLNL